MLNQCAHQTLLMICTSSQVWTWRQVYAHVGSGMNLSKHSRSLQTCLHTCRLHSPWCLHVCAHVHTHVAHTACIFPLSRLHACLLIFLCTRCACLTHTFTHDYTHARTCAFKNVCASFSAHAYVYTPVCGRFHEKFCTEVHAYACTCVFSSACEHAHVNLCPWPNLQGLS